MNRRHLGRGWTEEDRRTAATWRRGVAVLYGSMALLVSGVIAVTAPNIPPHDAGDQQISSAGAQSEPMEAKGDVSWSAR
jgi:hypothetical protein